MPKTVKIPFWESIQACVDCDVDMAVDDLVRAAKRVRKYALRAGNADVAAKMDAAIARTSAMVKELERLPDSIVKEARKLDAAPETTAYEHGGHVCSIEYSDDEDDV